MKPLRHALVIAIVCTVASAVTTGAQQPAPRRGAAPASPPAARKNESLRQLAERLAAENVELKATNDSLRADNDALRSQVEESEKALRSLQEKGGILRFLPPDPRNPKGARDTVPPNWVPRSFNGTTYYIVPLSVGAPGTSKPASPAPDSRR